MFVLRVLLLFVCAGLAVQYTWKPSSQHGKKRVCWEIEMLSLTTGQTDLANCVMWLKIQLDFVVSFFS